MTRRRTQQSGAKNRSDRRNLRDVRGAAISEPLEGRQLLAGLTLITHGFQLTGGYPAWLDQMGNAIQTRLGGNSSIYKLRVGENAQGNAVAVTSFVRESGPVSDAPSNFEGESIIKVDWAQVANRPAYSVASVADVVSTYLFGFNGPGLGFVANPAQLPIHLIGHSRGGSLVSELARLLGEKSIWVDHVTTLDPHPWTVPSPDDPTPTLYENSIFADNYYRSGDFPEGYNLDGAKNTNLTGIVTGLTGPTTHARVHTYYHGTIDTSANIVDGETIQSPWYTSTSPPTGPRGQIGFAWSRRGNLSSNRPVDGLSPKFGGTASRSALVLTGPAWPNVGDLRRTNGSGTVIIGSSIPIAYRYQYAGLGSAAVSWFYDLDRNPYNGTLGSFASTVFVPSTSSSAVSLTTTGSTFGRTPGIYYVCAKADDGQRARWSYLPDAVQLVNPDPPSMGNALQPISDSDTEWTDPGGPPNDNDGLIEARERPSLRVRLRSNAAISFVDATLSAASPDVVVTDPNVYFDDIPAGGSGWSVGRFDMDLDFDGQRTINLSMLVSYRIGAQQYYQTLPISKCVYPNPTDPAQFVFNQVTIVDPPAIGGGNNNDETFQSGERVDVIPRLRNNGVGTATGIEVYLTTSNPNIEVFASDVESYPDLGPGAQSVPNNGDAFRVRCVNRAFTGVASFDVHIRYDQSPNEVVVTNGLQLNIQPAPWLTMPVVYDFGVVAPGQNAVVTFSVGNVGSDDFVVSSFTLSDPAMAATPATPFTVTQGPPNNSREVVVTIPTSGLAGPMTRTIRVISNARLAESNANLMTITGFVGDSTPISQVPTSVAGDDVDISGTRVVYDDYRNGNADIYLLDLMTQEESRLTSSAEAQVNPRISGDWVAWESSSGVYAHNISTGLTIPVSAAANDERLIGVSNGKVAYLKEEFTFPIQNPPPSTLRIYNIYVYDLASGSTTRVSNYGAAVSGTSVTTPDSGTARNADFDGTRIAWQERVHSYAGNGTWSAQFSRRLLTQEIGGTPLTLLASSPGIGPRVLQDRVTWTARVGNKDQVFLWRNGQTTQVTSEARDHGQDILGLGSDYIVYDKDNVDGVYLWNLQANAEELLTNSIPYAYALRLDGNGVSLKGPPSPGRVYYGFIKHPEIGISPVMTISISSPLEGESITVTPVIRNLSNFARTDAITVRLYDGSPDAGGTLIGSPVILPNGLGANAQQAVQFSNVAFMNAGQHILYARVTMAGYDNPLNNTASVAVDVRDNDETGPLISNFAIVEHGSDGDGVIGSDEQIRISFQATDPSGVGMASLLVDGSQVTVTSLGGGSYEAVTGPYSPGDHAIQLTVTDADNSPASTIRNAVALVVPAELLATYFNGQRVLTGSTINLGVLAQGSTVAPSPFVIANEGDQALLLQSAAFPPGFVGIPPASLTIPPHETTTFTIRPSSQNLGMNIGPVSLPSSAAGSPFQFNVSATVIAAPRVTAGAFRFDSRPHDIEISFSDNVATSFSSADVQLINTSNGTSVAPATMSIAYNSATNQAAIAFSGLDSQTLVDGNYRLALAADGVTNQYGHPLQSDYVLDFFVFAGDANRDRTVNIADFSTLSVGFNLPGLFSQGDFNYSDTVEIGDFAILASKFNTSLPVARPATVASAPRFNNGAIAAAPRQSVVFGTEPIGADVLGVESDGR